MTAPAPQPQLSLDVPDPRSRFVHWLKTQRSWNTLLLLTVALVAAIIRFWNFGSLGYQHFDEFYFIAGAEAVGKSWPKGLGSISYVVTPLAPYTDGTLFYFFGANGWIPLAVSAIYGTLSSVALYFLGSRLYGNAIGLIAAGVLATAEFSVMFSRMALSDATFDFWLITSVLFIWLGFTRRRFMYWVLAGVSSGLLMNTKYNGAFPLALAGTWLVVEFGVELVVGRRRFLVKAWSEYLPRVVGVAGMVVVAVLSLAPWLVRLAHNPGFQTFFAHESGFNAYKTPPNFIVWYYWLWTSPPTVLLAVAGIAVAVVRFTRADRLMLIYTAGWFTAVLLFDAYPREALSLLPAVAIWVGRAIVEAWRLVRAWRPRLPLAAAATATVCASAILLGQVIPLPHLLSLRTQGYADAAAITDRYQASGGILLVLTTPVGFLYLHRYPYYVARPSSIKDLAANAPALYFMTDQSLISHSDLTDFFDLNRDRVQVVARVPNPLYPEVLIQPATVDGLLHLDDPPDAFRYITIWRVTAPFAFPSNWP